MKLGTFESIAKNTKSVSPGDNIETLRGIMLTEPGTIGLVTFGGEVEVFVNIPSHILISGYKQICPEVTKTHGIVGVC